MFEQNDLTLNAPYLCMMDKVSHTFFEEPVSCLNGAYLKNRGFAMIDESAYQDGKLLLEEWKGMAGFVQECLEESTLPLRNARERNKYMRCVKQRKPSPLSRMTHISTLLCRRYARGELPDLAALHQTDDQVVETLAAIKQREQDEDEMGWGEPGTEDEGWTNLASTEKVESKNKVGGDKIKALGQFLNKLKSLSAGRAPGVWGGPSKINQLNGLSGPGPMLLK
ncbi:MAG: hypothetical protein M1816_004570 [Peltula sp. TS41687]|nr:MAG: hypothetical protein M1816_004570 [Peltula sp. TS41687]